MIQCARRHARYQRSKKGVPYLNINLPQRTRTIFCVGGSTDRKGLTGALKKNAKAAERRANHKRGASICKNVYIDICIYIQAYLYNIIIYTYTVYHTFLFAGALYSIITNLPPKPQKRKKKKHTHTHQRQIIKKIQVDKSLPPICPQFSIETTPTQRRKKSAPAKASKNLGCPKRKELPFASP